jgi:signal transduction histidine kinase
MIGTMLDKTKADKSGLLLLKHSMLKSALLFLAIFYIDRITPLEFSDGKLGYFLPIIICGFSNNLRATFLMTMLCVITISMEHLLHSDFHDFWNTLTPTHRWTFVLGNAMNSLVTFVTGLLCLQMIIMRRAKLALIERLRLQVNDIEYVCGLAGHDMRNSIINIFCHNDLLQEISQDFPATPEQKQAMGDSHGYVRAAALRLDSIREILVRLLQTHNIYGIEEAFSLQDMVQEILVDLRRHYPDRELVLTTDHLPIIKGNRRFLYEIIYNLFDNSVRHNPQQKKIIVGLQMRISDQLLYFSMTDDGAGLAPEALKDLFLPRMGTADQPIRSGSGVGLFVIKYLIERFGGTLSYDQNVTKGAKFDFTYPMQPRQG